MAEESPGGYVFRGDDGSLYLIRDEILEACKMDGEDLEYARQQESDVEGFAMSTGPFESFSRVDVQQGPTSQAQAANLRAVGGSTTMCGW